MTTDDRDPAHRNGASARRRTQLTALTRSVSPSRARALSLTVLLAAVACGPPPVGGAFTSPMSGKRAEGDRGMVSASQPDAAAAGALILRRGGNAMDAAVATAFALSVTDISQTGLGGGGALTWYDGKARRADHISFYARTGEDPLWAADDSGWAPALRTARGAATPGMVAGLLEAHARHGRLTRAEVMAPAIALARDGFVVTPLLSRTIASARTRLSADTAATSLLMPGGEPLRAGQRLLQPALAATLTLIAQGGPKAFYEGPVAKALAADVAARSGFITERDLATYPVASGAPLCAEWRGHAVLSAPPPMGGAPVLAILQMAEAAGVTRASGFTSEEGAPEAVATLAGVQRLVSADATWWRGDPAVMEVPARGFASGGYATSRAALATAAVTDSVLRGDPWPYESAPLPKACDGFAFPEAKRSGAGDDGGDDTAHAMVLEDASGGSFTSHLAVVDGEGNAVSATTTVGVLFGSGIYTGGFFLNSSGGNLDERTRGTNRYANSTIAPTIVLDRGTVRLVIGAAGSLYIQPATAQVTMRILAFGEDAGHAIAAPRIQTTPARRDVEVEPGFSSPVYEALIRRGYRTTSRVADLSFGAVHAVHVRRDGRRIGVADPRRDGSAVAQ